MAIESAFVPDPFKIPVKLVTPVPPFETGIVVALQTPLVMLPILVKLGNDVNEAFVVAVIFPAMVAVAADNADIAVVAVIAVVAEIALAAVVAVIAVVADAALPVVF